MGRFKISMVLVFFFGLFSAFNAVASWTSIPSTDFEMIPPPEAGSSQYESDFRELHHFQDSRDQEQCDLAGTQTAPTFEAFYGPSSGKLSDKEYAKAESLLERVFKVSERISTYFKRGFHRERPYNEDTTIVPCVQKPKGATAYPSSHAVLATVGGCVLSKIFPSKSKELREYGTYLGELRVVVGVHHPSDVEAGQKLGSEICKRLLSEKDFQEELCRKFGSCN